MPLIGQLQVNDKTPAEAASLIADRYRNNKIIKKANVQIEFLEKSPNVTVRSAPFAVVDHVLVTVSDLAAFGVQTTGVFIVDRKGTIDTPAIFKGSRPNPPGVSSVAILGLTEFETEQKLIKAYASSQILANAEVYVEKISADEAHEYAPN